MTRTGKSGVESLARKVALAGVAVASALMMVLVGCDKKNAEEIKIGTINPTTGMYASFGQAGQWGAEAAVEDLNKMGGIKVGDKRLPVKLVAVNDESDPNKAGSLTESLILQDKVQFVVAGDCPPPMHAGVSAMADRYKVPYVASVGPFEPWNGLKQESPTKWKYSWAVGGFSINTPVEAGDPRAGKPGYTIFSTWTSMLDKYGAQTNKKIGIICSDEPDGRGWYTLFGPALQKLGYTVVGLDKNLGLVPLETTDFSSIIKAWQDAKVDILWGNCPGPFFGAVWKQATGMGFHPKMVSIGRGAMFYDDVNAWGGDLPYGVSTEVWWDPSLGGGAVGINGTTPQSLADRWVKGKNRPYVPAIAPGYACVQVLANAIERAGSVDPDKVNAALAETNMMSIRHLVKFDKNHFSHVPIVFGQWFKTNTPQKWELKVINSKHDFWPTTGEPMFPMP
nr:ABC transporter substrate-binding protein [uncultured Holophaga sp.]